MEFERVVGNKKDYLPLLLLADEQEDMIDRYLGKGEMYLAKDPEVVGECVVCKVDDGVYEIKNIATDPALHGKGYGRALMEHCLADARDRGKSGICMLGAEKQKAWLSDQSFARKYGFETVDETGYSYTLLARSFDGTLPRFTDQARAGTIEEKALTIYYSDQCPYAVNSLEIIRQVCGEAGAPYSLVPVDTLEKAKALPGVFNNYAVFYGGAFQTVNLLDAASLRRLLKR